MRMHGGVLDLSWTEISLDGTLYYRNTLCFNWRELVLHRGGSVLIAHVDVTGSKLVSDQVGPSACKVEVETRLRSSDDARDDDSLSLMSRVLPC